MSKLVAVRISEQLLSRVDRERKRAGLTRAAAINDALQHWIRTRHHEEAVRRDHEGYARHPVGPGEFDLVLGSQTWPK
jgi:metal-responsive CopG/Arc/MetJ family transcriptional regulator